MPYPANTTSPSAAPGAEKASGRKSVPTAHAFLSAAAPVSRRFFGPRSTPSMKSNGCSQEPFGPAGERPILLNRVTSQSAARSASGVPARRPLRSSDARNATSAWTRAAAGERAGGGAGAGCADAQTGRSRNASETGMRKVFIPCSLPRIGRARPPNSADELLRLRQDLVDLEEKAGACERSLEERDAGRENAVQADRFVRIARHVENGDAGPGFAQPPCQLGTALPRHHDVGQKKIDRAGMRGRLGEGFLRAGRLDD